MDEKEFVALLGQVGYPAETKNLGWAMRLKHMKPVVNFLASRACAPLTPAELSAYRALESEGKVRHDLVPQMSSAASLRLENEALARRLQAVRAKSAAARSQRDVLVTEVAQTKERVAKRKKLTAEAASVRPDVDEKNERINEQVAKVAAQCRELIALHSSEAGLLCANALEQYAGQEEQCTSEVRRLMERLFGSPDSTAAQQKRLQEHRLATQEEVARLQKSFVAGGVARAKALVELEKSKIGRGAGEAAAGEETAAEKQMQVAVLRRQTAAATEQLRLSLEETAQSRSSRVMLADYAAKSEELGSRVGRAKTVLTLLQSQHSRQSMIVATLQEEKIAVRHVANLLRTFLEALDGAYAAHTSCVSFWATLHDEKGVALAEESVRRCLRAAVGGLGSASATELTTLAQSGREAKAKEEREANHLLVQSENLTKTWLPIVWMDQTVEGEMAKATKALGEATALLCHMEKQRLAVEGDFKARHPDIVAVERALMTLFWENPKDPEKLNQKLSALKERVFK